MRLLNRLVGLACLVGCASACTTEVEPLPRTDAREQSVVYGTDDREDYYASESELFRTRTRESIVALIPAGRLDTSNPNDVRVVAPTLQSAYDLCDDQRFLNQPTAANCSATLIDDDLVLTAGHCVTSTASCRGYRYVFDYYYAAEDDLETIGVDDVYNCQELVVQALSGGFDYAILQLDRPVVGHAPAPVRPEQTALANGASVPVIGFGSGLPAKIDLGGTVLDGRPATLDYLVTTNDTFGGNSGSGVFDAAGAVVGILVRGETDYVSAGSCDVVNVLPDPPGFGSGEEVTYAWRAVQALCDEADFPSARLCGGPTGEGWCDPCEGVDDCPAGWECLPDPDGAALACALACDGDDQCRSDHSCTGGFCRPNREPRCSEGNVWDFNACGQRVDLTDVCSANEVCQGSVCVPRPAGDTCTSPTALSPVTQTVTGSLAGYFPDETGSCEGDGPERVYTFTTTEDVRFEATATGFDTVVYLRGTCADPASEVACSDDATPPGSRGSHIVVNLTPGTYFLFMDAFSGGDSYALDLVFDYDFVPPEGDTCGAPTVLTPVTQTVTGTLAGYTNDYRGTCAGDGPERVYQFTLADPTRLVALASGFDTTLYVRTACSAADSEVVCNDDIVTGEDRRSRFDITLDPGTYFLFMDAWSQNVGNYTLTLTFTPQVCTPQCELGATQCVGANVQVCVLDAEGCERWATRSCPSGTSCQDGVCAGVCTDECASAGGTECTGDFSLHTCGNFDGDPCLEWSAPVDCVAGEPCSGGVCGCPVDCVDGDRRCNGNTVELCISTDALCATFVPVETCGAGAICSDGTCVSVCSEPCEPGARRCAADGQATEVCVRRDDGCFGWAAAGRCREGETCIDGLCEGVCDDTCEEGSRRCSAEGGRIEICQVADLGCTEWSAGPSCEGLGGCEGGECRDGCVDECPADGNLGCVNETRFHECGDLDEDGCLEWHPSVPCPTDWTCDSFTGRCEPSCGDDDFEPNESSDEAVAIELDFSATLAACATDEDWFALRVGAETGVVVDLSPRVSESGEVLDLDVELYVEDALVGSDPQPAERPEQVSYRALADETVLIRVFSPSDEPGETVYDLTVSPGDSLDDECEPDERRCSETENGLEKCVIGEGGRLVWSVPDLCGPGRTCQDGACVGGLSDVPDAGDASVDGSLASAEPRPLGVNGDGCGCAAGGGPAPASAGLWLVVAAVIAWPRRRGR